MVISALTAAIALSQDGFVAQPPLYTLVVLRGDQANSLGVALHDGVAYGFSCYAYSHDMTFRACRWLGPLGFVSIHDSERYLMTQPYGAGPGGAVGRAFLVGGGTSAIYWPGGDGKPITLNPGPGFTSRAAWANERYQFGTVSDSRTDYPARWAGDRDTFLNMTPFGYRGGDIYGGGDEIQVGSVGGPDPNFPERGALAGYWRETPESFVSLHPAGWKSTVALGAGGGQQVGYGYRFSANRIWKPGPRALLWRGTPQSVVDLQPERIHAASEASATNGVHQVGFYTIAGGPYRATRWSGYAKSMHDLHRYAVEALGRQVTDSEANDIASDGTIIGTVYLTASRSLAVLWIPKP